jgi:HEAT repeat protein
MPRADATERLRAVLASRSATELTGSLDDSSPEVARAAVKRLVEVAGSGAAPELRARLLSADLSLVSDLASALRAIRDDQAVETAIAGLREEPYVRRLAAAFALGVLRDPRAAGALREVLKDKLAGVRKAALGALAELGPNAESADACAQLLSDPDPHVRIAAIRAVARATVRPGPLLAEVAGDEQQLVRLEAARHVASLPHPAAEALLADPDLRVREAAAHAAGRTQIDGLAGLLSDDPAADVRHAAASTLGRLGDAEVAELLLPAVEDPDAIVRAAVLRSLERILGRVGAVGRLSRELRAERPRRRRASLYALAHLKGKEAHAEVARLVEDPDSGVRLALVEVVDELLSDPVPPIRYLADDADPYVRHSAELRLVRRSSGGEAGR